MPALEDLITAGDVADGTHSHSGADVTSGTVPIARIPTGTTGTTVPFGNDARFTDSRTPTAHAASHASGGGDAVLPAAASQAEMEAGTEAALRAVSPLRVAQAIAALAAGGTAELNYVEFTSNVAVTATVEASADVVITSGAIAYDGSTAVIIEFFSPGWQSQATANVAAILWLYDGASSIGRIATILTPAAGTAGLVVPVLARRRITPSAATHTYSIRGTTQSGTANVSAGAGGAGNIPPGFIRITRA